MPKRVLQGVVVSDKNDKTIVVKVERRFTHPLLKKTVRRTKNYHAHDEGNSVKIGQQVSIEESAPISKLKRWRVVGDAAAAATANKESRQEKSSKAKA
jgi:small subunit ribosomal protein S17